MSGHTSLSYQGGLLARVGFTTHGPRESQTSTCSTLPFEGVEGREAFLPRAPDQPTSVRGVGPEVPRGLAPFWRPTWSHVGHLGATWGGLGGLLGASWAVLEASWGLLAAKTQHERGESVFWDPLGAVLGSFLGPSWRLGRRLGPTLVVLVRLKIDAKIDRKSDASWNRFLEGFW